MCSASFFMEIKTLTEKILLQEICASWKQMLGIDKKPSFLLKSIYLYNIWYLAALKTLNPRNEVLYFKSKLTLSKTTQWLSVLLVAHQEGRFSLFHFFGVVSVTFKPLLACYDLSHVASFFTSSSVTECFGSQIYHESTSWRFYYKGFQALS